MIKGLFARGIGVSGAGSEGLFARGLFGADAGTGPAPIVLYRFSPPTPPASGTGPLYEFTEA